MARVFEITLTPFNIVPTDLPTEEVEIYEVPGMRLTESFRHDFLDDLLPPIRSRPRGGLMIDRRRGGRRVARKM